MTCPECNGDEQVDCPLCVGDDPDCVECGGTGDVDCPACDGTGKVAEIAQSVKP